MSPGLRPRVNAFHGAWPANPPVARAADRPSWGRPRTRTQPPGAWPSAVAAFRRSALTPAAGIERRRSPPWALAAGVATTVGPPSPARSHHHDDHGHPATTPPTTTTEHPPEPRRRPVGPQGHRGRAEVRQRPHRRQDHAGQDRDTLDLLVNGDGEGGGKFIQHGNIIKIERVGPLLYFNAPKKFWATQPRRRRPRPTAASGSSSRRSTRASSPSTSSSMRPTSSPPPSRATRHRSPWASPTTFDGHKVVIVKDTVTNGGKRSTGLMYIAARARPTSTRSSTTPRATRARSSSPTTARRSPSPSRPTPSTSRSAARLRHRRAAVRGSPAGQRRRRIDYLNMSPSTLAAPTPAAAPSTPWWSSRSGMYSPMTPARIGIGIDCSQIRPGPVSTAKWCPSEPM